MKECHTVLMEYPYRQEWRSKYVKISKIVEWTRDGKHLRTIEAVRGLRMPHTDGSGMITGTLAAKGLPRILPARCQEKPGYTGLVLLSFRIREGVETLEQLRSMVNLWSQTLLSFVGSSGSSLKVLIPYQLTGGGLPTDEVQVALFQQYAYKRAAEYVLASTGIKPEEVIHDGTESFRLSSDPDVYYNPDAIPIEMAQPTEPLNVTSARIINQPAEVPLNTKMLPGYTRSEMDATKYSFICRELANGPQLDKEPYLALLATECCKAGIDKELAIKMTISMGAFFQKDIMVRAVYNAAYEKHPMGVANPVERSLMHQQLLEEFLHRRYMFRRNKVTEELEYQEKFRYVLSWKPLTEAAKNDINNEAIREGIKVWPKDLERILVSEWTESYDPVREWLDTLPRWDGRDRLGELADRVKTSTQGWRDNFKIWMRSMVSQWRAGMDAMYGAQMVLMLVGGQGTRKSTFMRMLLPRELMTFYIDRIDFANRKEALRALSRFLLINIDEYDQVSKSQMAFLKHLIQRTDVKERKLYSTRFEQQQRYAAFCATTNSLAPLKDDSGSRRYLVVEVSGIIDTDTQADRQIDYRQLYAQIVYEIEHGEEYAFTGEREQLIIAQNADYYDTPNVVSLFDDLFRKPQAGDEVLLLSPTEILTRIRDERKVNVVSQANATLIGSYLHRKGYQKGKGRQGRRYMIAPQA